MKRMTYMKRHPEYPFEWLDVVKKKPPHHTGYWVAAVESPRFTTRCHRCDGRKKITVYLKEDDSDLPSKERERVVMECFICEGTGKVTGLHAVVMRHGEMVWDPSPKRDMGIGGYRGETVFVVSDPAQLTRVA